MRLRKHALRVVTLTLIYGLLGSAAGPLMAGTTNPNFVVDRTRKTASSHAAEPAWTPGPDQTNTSESASVQPEQTITVPGNAIAGAEQFVANLQTGDQVTINGISGTVNFNLKPLCTPEAISYIADANGLARSIFNDPNNAL